MLNMSKYVDSLTFNIQAIIIPFMVSIIFDFNRTLYDPIQEQLYTDALKCLESLKDLSLGLLTTQAANRNNTLFAELGILDYFTHIIVTRQKTQQHLADFAQILHTPHNQIFVVGDRLDEEIAFGNELGMQTIWLDRNRSFIQNTANYQIHSLSELPEIIRKDSHGNR